MSDIIHEFNKSIEFGKKGEADVKAYLSKGSNIESINDVSQDPSYYDKDIDFLVKLKNGDDLTVEIKSDKHTTGNLYYETISNIQYNVPGCMVKSKAKSLLYYFTETKELYLINFKAYRRWFEQNKHRFKEITIKNETKGGNGISYSKGYLIPKKVFEEEFDGFNKVDIVSRDKLILKANQIGDDGAR